MTDIYVEIKDPFRKRTWTGPDVGTVLAQLRRDVFTDYGPLSIMGNGDPYHEIVARARTRSGESETGFGGSELHVLARVLIDWPNGKPAPVELPVDAAYEAMLDQMEQREREIEEVGRRQRAYLELLGAARRAVDERDSAIGEALAVGITQREIAKLTGLSTGRIAQIAQAVNAGS